MTTEGLLHAHTLQTLPSTVWPAARGDRHVRITGAPLCHPTDVHTESCVDASPTTSVEEKAGSRAQGSLGLEMVRRPEKMMASRVLSA